MSYSYWSTPRPPGTPRGLVHGRVCCPPRRPSVKFGCDGARYEPPRPAARRPFWPCVRPGILFARPATARSHAHADEDPPAQAQRLLRPVRRRHGRHQRLGRRRHRGLPQALHAASASCTPGRHGIVGALTEDLIDTSRESAAAIRALRHTPAGAFGSARYKLKSIEQDRAKYERLIEVFRAHDIGYFFYNGGNDSMDTALKVSKIGAELGYPIICVGVPKTVDNDLPVTDCCPGFGSVAKYVAVSTREAALDVASMARTSTKVFILEVMGRHAGWIAAAGGLAGRQAGDAPHIILFPEIPFEQKRFLARVKRLRHRASATA